MDRFSQLETFVQIAQRGSLSAAASATGVATAVISRRLSRLESRLGIKLFVRTTRKLTLTHEGNRFLADAQRILAQMQDAEAAVSLGSSKMQGEIRLTAPAGFGRRHVAPLLPGFLASHPGLSVTLELTDGLTDIVSDRFDVAVRLGTLEDSSLVGVKLANNRRVVVASPRYLRRYGEPTDPQALGEHNCLTFGNYGNQARGWQFMIDGRLESIRVAGKMQSNDGSVLLDWALAGCGLAWRSMWEVQAELHAGRLQAVLEPFSAPDNAIYAVYAQRKHLALRVRALLDMLKQTYARPDYWSPATMPGRAEANSPQSS